MEATQVSTNIQLIQNIQCVYIYTHTHTHNEILLSHLKNEILPFGPVWMDLENTMLCETDRERQPVYDITYIWKLKNNTNKRV